MPRVLHVLNRLIIGGPAFYAAYLARYLPPPFESLLAVGEKDEHEQDATFLAEELGLEPVSVPGMKRAIAPRHDRQAYRHMKDLIRRYRPDVVHTHAAKSGAIGRLAASACGVPVVVHTFHGHVFHSYFNRFKTAAFIRIERYLAGLSTGILSISEGQKTELADTYRICPAGKITVIPLGIDLRRFAEDQAAKRARFRAQFCIGEDEVAVGIVGRVVPIKNHELFAAAAGILQKQTSTPLRFVVIGDGDARPAMEAAFAAAGVAYAYAPDGGRTDAAICTSWHTAVDEVMAGLDVVALTSHNEGTPGSLIEAQAAGRPVVATRVGGVADVVADEATGFLTPPGDAAALANALLPLVESASLRSSIGGSGARYAQDHFSYQRLVADMAAYYERLLSARSR